MKHPLTTKHKRLHSSYMHTANVLDNTCHYHMSNIIAPVPATFTTNTLSELILVLPGRTGDGDDGTVLSESCCSEFLALHPNYPTVRLALALNLRCYYPLQEMKPLAQTGTQVHSLA